MRGWRNEYYIHYKIYDLRNTSSRKQDLGIRLKYQLVLPVLHGKYFAKNPSSDASNIPLVLHTSQYIIKYLRAFLKISGAIINTTYSSSKESKRALHLSLYHTNTCQYLPCRDAENSHKRPAKEYKHRTPYYNIHYRPKTQ